MGESGVASCIEAQIGGLFKYLEEEQRGLRFLTLEIRCEDEKGGKTIKLSLNQKITKIEEAK